MLFTAACSDSTGDSSPGTSGSGAGNPGGTGASGGGGNPAGTGGSDGGSGGTGGAPGIPEEIHFYGRFDESDAAGPRFAWSGTSIATRFSGSSIDVTLDDSGNNFFQVILDGSPASVIVTAGGSQAYSLATGLPAGMHDIELYRRAEAFQGVVQFQGFTPGEGGALIETVSPYVHRVEFIGDSITAGYGVEGDSANCSFTPDTENAHLTYAAIAARSLNAEAHLIAWSGKGVYQNYGGDQSEPMPDLYGRTLPQDAGSQWDFGAWAAEAVVINLGTNDFSVAVDEGAFTSAYVALLQDVRSHYPDATIFCVAGPFLNDLATQYIGNAITTAADPQVLLVPFPSPDPADGLGCDYHPSVATHAKLGQLLADTIQQELSW
jgi:lysophospholipase L1-like esterase